MFDDLTSETDSWVGDNAGNKPTEVDVDGEANKIDMDGEATKVDVDGKASKVDVG